MQIHEELVDARLVPIMEELMIEKQKHTATLQSLRPSLSTIDCEAIWTLKKLAEIQIEQERKV